MYILDVLNILKEDLEKAKNCIELEYMPEIRAKTIYTIKRMIVDVELLKELGGTELPEPPRFLTFEEFKEQQRKEEQNEQEEEFDILWQNPKTVAKNFGQSLKSLN